MNEVYLIRDDTRNSIKNRDCDVYPDKGSVIYNTKFDPLRYGMCLKEVKVTEWSMRLKNDDPEDWNGSGPAVIYQTTEILKKRNLHNLFRGGSQRTKYGLWGGDHPLTFTIPT